MSWSKVKEPYKKPLGWWRNKILCELFYAIGKDKFYWKYLTRLCKRGYNLYGEPFTKPKVDAEQLRYDKLSPGWAEALKNGAYERAAD